MNQVAFSTKILLKLGTKMELRGNTVGSLGTEILVLGTHGKCSDPANARLMLERTPKLCHYIYTQFFRAPDTWDAITAALKEGQEERTYVWGLTKRTSARLSHCCSYCHHRSGKGREH